MDEKDLAGISQEELDKLPVTSAIEYMSATEWAELDLLLKDNVSER